MGRQGGGLPSRSSAPGFPVGREDGRGTAGRRRAGGGGGGRGAEGPRVGTLRRLCGKGGGGSSMDRDKGGEERRG